MRECTTPKYILCEAQARVFLESQAKVFHPRVRWVHEKRVSRKTIRKLGSHTHARVAIYLFISQKLEASGV
jgi:hypothetical protein